MSSHYVLAVGLVVVIGSILVFRLHLILLLFIRALAGDREENLLPLVEMKQ